MPKEIKKNSIPEPKPSEELDLLVEFVEELERQVEQVMQEKQGKFKKKKK